MGAEDFDGVEAYSWSSVCVEVLRGVLKGERKGLDNVDVARSMRRRFAAGLDMMLVL